MVVSWHRCACRCFWGPESCPAEAQIGGGAFAGRIVDQAGTVVPGATVTVVDTATNRSRTVVTRDDGAYVVHGLAPGTYRIRVELSGFRTLARDGIRLPQARPSGWTCNSILAESREPSRSRETRRFFAASRPVSVM